MDDAALTKLIHDVNSKCSSLKSAAGMLKDANAEERAEFLKLMREQARSLVEALDGESR